MITAWSTTQELRGRLGQQRSKTEQTLRKVLRGVCRNWYDDDRTVFDKSRGWTGKVRLFKYLFPRGKVIVLVRDLREVFASFEKQDRKNPALRMGPRLTIEQRASNIFSDNGMIGGPLSALKGIVDSKESVVLVRYEDLASNPEATMREIYKSIDKDYYADHDYDNVINASEEPDNLWLFKYPHEGAGQVRLQSPQWERYISKAFAHAIVNKFSWFYSLFYPEVIESNVDSIR
jgi:hypothetical protein